VVSAGFGVPWRELPLVVVVVLAGVAILRSGPSDRTRAGIAAALQARGLTLLSLKPTWIPQFRTRSRRIFVARAENPFGLVQTIYFSVDAWSNLLKLTPNLHDLGSRLDLSVWLASDDG
jgi:hypothetical protein